MKITLSIIKADVGSVGGHTKPTEKMMNAVRADSQAAIEKGLIIDAFV
ncbi:MAG: fructose 1,6-bisphosphatase, partial [Dehalococcoidia bacterium]|nr:fructose 1,6-bisphosphatase [Dehalococcoidia bacterium]